MLPRSLSAKKLLLLHRVLLNGKTKGGYAVWYIFQIVPCFYFKGISCASDSLLSTWSRITCLQNQAPPSHVHGKIWSDSTQFWLWFCSINTFFGIPCTCWLLNTSQWLCQMKTVSYLNWDFITVVSGTAPVAWFWYQHYLLVFQSSNISVGFYGQNNGCGIILLLFDNIPTSHFSSKCVNVVVGICSDLRFVKKNLHDQIFRSKLL